MPPSCDLGTTTDVVIAIPQAGKSANVLNWHKCEVTRLFQQVRFAPQTGPSL